MVIQNINYKILLINLVISFIPISFIGGNLMVNLNILILILTGLLLFGSEIFKFKLEILDYFIIIFFTYIILNGIINNFFNFDFPTAPDQHEIMKKSFLFLRFFILYFLIKYLVLKNLINFRLIFLFFGLCSLFVSIDVLIQYIFGKDIFGFESSGRRMSGPFGDELIAGGFIQRFFIFMPFALLLYFKNPNKFSTQVIFFIVFALTTIASLFAGNRIPLFLTILILIIILFYEKTFRKALVVLFVTFFAAFSYLLISNKNISFHYKIFALKSNQIVNYFKIKLSNEELKIIENTHIKEFETGSLTWKQNKLFGGGIKSFYFNCKNVSSVALNVRGATNCNSHPHNYYLEIATELGLAGIVLTISIFSLIFYLALKKIHDYKTNSNEKRILLSFFLIFFAEIFPFKTTGSFFTTSNSTFLFIILSFIVGLIFSKKEKIYEK